jgi:hypothetical protein
MNPTNQKNLVLRNRDIFKGVNLSVDFGKEIELSDLRQSGQVR